MPTLRHQSNRKPKDPCLGCFLHRTLCLCDLIPALSLRTKVSLVVHYSELRRTTNTGRLAIKALMNSEMRVRGEVGSAQDLSALLTPDYRTFLLYPSSDAVELDQALVNQSDQPIQLIVPDGTWRQASKVHTRHHELRGVQRVMMSAPNHAQFRLRKENSEYGMATLQAIAHALGVIEGEGVMNQLLALYNVKLERTLMGRGVMKAGDLV